MSYYPQQFPPVGIPLPQGYPPAEYPPTKDAYPPPEGYGMASMASRPQYLAHPQPQDPQQKKESDTSSFIQGCLAVLCCCCLLDSVF